MAKDNRNIMIGVGGLVKPSSYCDRCTAGVALDEARTLRHVPLSGTISVRSGCLVWDAKVGACCELVALDDGLNGLHKGR